MNLDVTLQVFDSKECASLGLHRRACEAICIVRAGRRVCSLSFHTVLLTLGFDVLVSMFVGDAIHNALCMHL